MIEHVQAVADWLADTTRGVNALLFQTQFYLCADASSTQDGRLTANTSVTAPGAATLTVRVHRGTSTQTHLQWYRDSNGVAIVDAVVTWTGNVPSVAASVGSVVSITRDVLGYVIVLSGTAIASGAHGLLLEIATAVPGTSTGTIYCGGWSFTNAAFSVGDSTDMTSWTAQNATATAVAASALPLAVSVYDDSRNAIVARKRWPQDLVTTHGLLVYDLGTQWQVGIQSGYQDGVCQVGVLLVIPAAATDDAIEDIGYIARVVRQCLNDLSEPTNESSRTLNGIVLMNLRDLAEPPPEAEIADVMVMAALQSTWDVRDTTP